jgi:AcrR family transcriptional regulator
MQAQPVTINPTFEDGDKRRQIIKGAMEAFLDKGFDAASMSEIARMAGVSKGTLYVYFRSKEELFDAIVSESCKVQAAQVFELDPNDHDVAAALTRTGILYATIMCRPEDLSALRTVIAISARMPELGRRFYDAGPARGSAQLQSYLEAQTAAGVLAVDDCEVAAAQFIDAVTATTFKPALFDVGLPTPERIEHVVKIAVRTFLAAYKVS